MDILRNCYAGRHSLPSFITCRVYTFLRVYIIMGGLISVRLRIYGYDAWSTWAFYEITIGP